MFINTESLTEDSDCHFRTFSVVEFDIYFAAEFKQR